MRTIGVIAVLAAGCTSQISRGEQEIIGGSRSTGMAATVLLASYPANKSVLDTCTAVLVSPTVLLTAAHCVDSPNHPNYIYGVFTGDDASAYPTLVALEPHLVPVTAVHPSPQYQTAFPFFADIGVVELASPLAITPVPLQRAPLDVSVTGKQAQIIGYGQTVYQQKNSARYDAMTIVGALDTDTVVVGDGTRHGCLGDSGGPAIVDGKLVGIDSYGPVGCGSAAHYRRVDMFLPFIDQYVPAAAGPDAGPGGGGGGGGVSGGDAGLDPIGGDRDGGGCAVGGGRGSSGALLVAVALIAARRRRTR